MASEPRPAIPEPMKRAIRQRCGYGCVICGRPLYEYEHMEGWANVQRHVPEEITLLCDNHHRERTNGLLPIEDVRRADKNPFNRREGASPPHPLHYSGSSCSASIGGSEFQAARLGEYQVLVPVVIDLLPMVMFRLEDGNILLSLNSFRADNSPALIIIDNELRFATEAWDIKFVGRRIEIREGHGEFLLQADFEVPSRIVINQGVFAFNGVRVDVSPEGIYVVNTQNLYANTYSAGASAGIVIGSEEPRGIATNMRIVHVPRFQSIVPIRADQASSNALVDAELIFLDPKREWKLRSGEHLEGLRVLLDGFHWKDCKFENCEFMLAAKKEAFAMENCEILRPRWRVIEGAERTFRSLSSALRGSDAEREAIEGVFQAIRDGANPRRYLARCATPQLRTDEAYYTAAALSGLRNGFGAGGESMIEGWIRQIRAGK